MTEQYNSMPGIHREVFSVLNSKTEQFEDIDKHCVLLVDEMALKTQLFYNLGKDEIIGFVEDGQQKLFEPAQNGCAFMLRGIHYNWKQSAEYYLVQKTSLTPTPIQFHRALKKDLHLISFILSRRIVLRISLRFY
ncbi:hypothetical protein Trydic_g11546 [Trypoxylus dichotomus]